MSRIDGIKARLRRLEPAPHMIEKWPPEEGSLAWAWHQSLLNDGVVVPEKPPGEPGLMFLAQIDAAVWDQ